MGEESQHKYQITLDKKSRRLSRDYKLLAMLAEGPLQQQLQQHFREQIQQGVRKQNSRNFIELVSS